MLSIWRMRMLLSVAVLLCSGLPLLAQISVPAIDPSGQRIFAPQPTTVVNPFASSGQGRCCLTNGCNLNCTSWFTGGCCLGRTLRPAWTTPPTPPPCPPDVTPAPVVAPPVVVAPPPVAPQTVLPAQPVSSGCCDLFASHRSSGRRGSIQLTPSRIIAPIDSEVVLKAGLCGEDNRFVTRQPIEWFLSQESVGHLVAVGQDDRNVCVRAFSDDERRRNGSFAIGRTSNKAYVLDRGTANTADDMAIKAGETWVSVTSSAEGVSRISAVAPEAENWDGRRQSATVYWIDGQWIVPAPQIAKAGTPHQLTTLITRTSNGAPVPGWTVRYEIIEASTAQFVSYEGTTGNVADVATDGLGRATITITQPNATPGLTRIRVTIIRPASVDGSFPQLTLGQSFTSVQWSAPGLVPCIDGPQTMNVGETGTFRMEVHNTGDVPLGDVAVTYQVPPGMSPVGSNPQGQVFGNRVEWRLPSVAPGAVSTIEVQVRAETGGQVQHNVVAQSSDGLRGEASMVTHVFQNSLNIQTAGPEVGRIGEPLTFRISVTNTGNLPLMNVVVADQLDPGLQHETQTTRIERSLGTLNAGQTLDFAVTLTAVQTGQVCHTLVATADGGHTASTRACVLIQNTPAADIAPEPAAPASMSVRKTGPSTVTVGGVAQFTIIVTNNGGEKLTNVRVLDMLPPSMVPSFATQGFFREQGGLLWVIKELPPAHEVTMYVHATCPREDAQACNRVTVSCDQLPPQTDQACVAVIAPGGMAPPIGPPVAPPQNPAIDSVLRDPRPETGSMSIVMSSLNNPIVAGQGTTYIVLVRNDRNVNDQNVTLTLRLPANLQFERLVDGPVQGQSVARDGRSVAFAPIRELRPGEAVTFRVLLRGTARGSSPVQAEVVSQKQTQAAVQQLSTTVN